MEEKVKKFIKYLSLLTTLCGSLLLSSTFVFAICSIFSGGKAEIGFWNVTTSVILGGVIFACTKKSL